MSSRSSVSPKPSKAGAILGRSAATGRVVLEPASKHGSISIKRAREAASSLLRDKKP